MSSDPSGRDCPISIACGASSRPDRIEPSWSPSPSFAIATALCSQSTHFPPGIIEELQSHTSSVPPSRRHGPQSIFHSFGSDSNTALPLPEAPYPSSVVVTWHNFHNFHNLGTLIAVQPDLTPYPRRAVTKLSIEYHHRNLEFSWACVNMDIRGYTHFGEQRFHNHLGI
jgi:hypothetical protein